MQTINIIRGLEIFLSHVPEKEKIASSVTSGYDTLYAPSFSIPLSDEERIKLEELGWSYNEYDFWHANI